MTKLATGGIAAVLMVAASASAQTNDTAVNHMPADKVAAAFAKGVPLIETDAYKVLAARRDRDGQAEVHALDTDIMYILEGTATLVTGGRVVNGKDTAAGEVRGESIAEGDVRPLVKGDVIVIPPGVPHLFKDVKAPFLYYVVKVTHGQGR
jgi:quercetin dioxygenase-like cupin family protein